MASLASKKQPPNNSNGNNKEEEDQQQEEEDNHQAGPVTTHLYLKPTDTTGAVDKAVVLRRIRHRKRVNKVKSAVQSLFRSPNTDDNTSSVTHIRWADDAFAAP